MAEASKNGGRDGMNGRDGRDSRPVPDPTVLTSEMVEKATAALKESLEAKMQGQREVFEARLAGMDMAVKLLQTILDRVPGDCEGKVRSLETLISERFSTAEEKFKSVDTRIGERDEKVKEAKADAKVGIDAALASAEKLVGQSNSSFEKAVDKAELTTATLLKQQAESQQTTAKSLEDKITDLKGRLDRIEGAAVGTITAKTDGVVAQNQNQMGNSWVLSLVMAAVTVIAVVFSIVTALR